MLGNILGLSSKLWVCLFELIDLFASQAQLFQHTGDRPLVKIASHPPTKWSH